MFSGFPWKTETPAACHTFLEAKTFLKWNKLINLAGEKGNSQPGTWAGQRCSVPVCVCIFCISPVLSNTTLSNLWVLSWAILGEGDRKEGGSYEDVGILKLHFSRNELELLISPLWNHFLRKSHFAVSLPCCYPHFDLQYNKRCGSSLHFHYFMAIFYFLVIIFDGKGEKKTGIKGMTKVNIIVMHTEDQRNPNSEFKNDDFLGKWKYFIKMQLCHWSFHFQAKFIFSEENIMACTFLLVMLLL